MVDTERIVNAAKFVAKNQGKEVYILDNLECGECPDLGTEDCPMRDSPCSLDVELSCREKRMIVRAVCLDFVDVSLSVPGNELIIKIDDCYAQHPEDIFTDRAAAEEHLDSLPDDILKFQEPEQEGGAEA